MYDDLEQCGEAIAEAPGGALPPGPVADKTGLSNDYLNHYCEALMLIELAAFDEGVVADLAGWRPVDYRAYFEASPLRRADAAIAAYDALPAIRRAAFEEMIEALDKLTQSAILALQPPCHASTVALIGEVIGPAIRRLLDQAAAFLNSGGVAEPHSDFDAQALVDQLIV
jgi:hypothetical protein